MIKKKRKNLTYDDLILRMVLPDLEDGSRVHYVVTNIQKDAIPEVSDFVKIQEEVYCVATRTFQYRDGYVLVELGLEKEDEEDG